MTYTAVDYHTGGEPFRIVTRPFELDGSDVADRRVRAIESREAQEARQLLCFEPRGHADMYGGFLVPPDDEQADLGVLFWHKDGFSTACGHGTIALGAWAVESGLVSAPADGTREVVIDVPSGRVSARVHLNGGRVRNVEFVSVASSMVARDVRVETSAGAVEVDVAYGGAVYAHVNVEQLGLSVEPTSLHAFIALGREIQEELNATGLATREDARLTGVYGVIFFEEHPGQQRLRQRNVTIFADGQVDRSPCGSGTASRVAALADRGTLHAGDVLEHESIVGSVFLARYEQAGTFADGQAWVTPIVTGTAHLTGRHEFVVDPADSMNPGFVLR